MTPTRGTSGKRGKGWTGYKVHISETCHIPDADGRRPAPDLLTSTETTPAPVTDVEMTETVHNALARRGLTPGEHALDSGYASGELLLAARARGITLLAPLLPDSSPQARSGGYTADMFTIDWDSKQVTCPQGAVSSSWTPARSKGTSIIIARFTEPPALSWTVTPLVSLVPGGTRWAQRDGSSRSSTRRMRFSSTRTQA